MRLRKRSVIGVTLKIQRINNKKSINSVLMDMTLIELLQSQSPTDCTVHRQQVDGNLKDTSKTVPCKLYRGLFVQIKTTITSRSLH